MWSLSSPHQSSIPDTSDLLVLSYRNHHNAYTENDGSGAVIQRYACPTHWSFHLIQFIFSFIIVHYLWYWLIAAALLLTLTYAGYWWLSLSLIVAYLPSYCDGSHLNTGRPWNWYRQNPLWYFSHQYTELELVRTARLNPSRRYVFAVHPHGILIISRIGVYGGTFERLFPGIDTRTLGASPMFYVPCAREICLWMGAVDANKKTAHKILNQSSPKLSLFIYPGGSKEIFHTDPNSTNTAIIARRGFIRLAVQRGCDLVPVFVFREKYMYKVWRPPHRVINFFLSVFKTPVLLFWGRFCSWLPYPTYMSIVFDAPIQVTQNDHPTEEEVERLYEQYTQRMRALWEKYHKVYGYGEEETLTIADEGKATKRKTTRSSNGQTSHADPDADDDATSLSTSPRKD